MSETYANDGGCHETSGFLFSHPCDRFSVGNCSRCQKPLCEEHSHHIEEGIVCTSCLKKEARTGRLRNQTTREYYHEHYYYDDPYFYGPRYYPNYGSSTSTTHRASSTSGSPDDASGGGSFGLDSANDPSDFTEGDADSLRREDDGDFETDMGAS